MTNWFNHLAPYTNVHELNLDWIINKIKELDEKVDDLVNGDFDQIIEQYFNRIMIDAIYHEDDEEIELKKELIVADGNHIYNAGTKTMTIE